MKTIVVCLSLLTVGCFGQTYTSTKVGPDRYAVISAGNDNGPENYSHILEEAYNTCKRAAYKDYVVTNVAFEDRRVVAFVNCQKEVVTQNTTTSPSTSSLSSNSATNTEAEKKEETNKEDISSFKEDLDKLYKIAKKKVENLNKE